MSNVRLLHNLRLNRRPTVAELERIPLATAGEFELNDKEARGMRAEIYKINKDGIRRYRTLRDGPYIMVWRIKQMSWYKVMGKFRLWPEVYRNPRRDTLFFDFGSFVIRFGEGWL